MLKSLPLALSTGNPLFGKGDFGSTKFGINKTSTAIATTSITIRSNMGWLKILKNGDIVRFIGLLEKDFIRRIGVTL
jgi:hypothetical protein